MKINYKNLNIQILIICSLFLIVMFFFAVSVKADVPCYHYTACDDPNDPAGACGPETDFQCTYACVYDSTMYCVENFGIRECYSYVCANPPYPTPPYATPPYATPSYATPSYGYQYQTPSYSYQYQTPSYGYEYQTPVYAYQYQYETPAGSYAYQYQTPSYGYQTPSYGYQTPSYGYQTPAYGTPIGTYLLSVTKSGSGLVKSLDSIINCGASCSSNYPSGTSVTLSATPSSSYWKFDGWSGDCSGIGSCTLNLTAPKSVIATFSTRLFNYKEF